MAKKNGPCPLIFTSITGISPRNCIGATATVRFWAGAENDAGKEKRD
jgi:hypothetical protein